MTEKKYTAHIIKKTQLGKSLFWSCSCGGSSPKGFATERERSVSIHTHIRNSRR